MCECYKKWLAYIVPSLLIVCIYIGFLFGNSSIKYDILFSQIHYSNDVVEVSFSGYLNDNSFEIVDVSRRNLFDGRTVDIFSYKGYNFYAYIDESVDYNTLLDLGIQKRVNVTVPVFKSGLEGSEVVERNYIESNQKVYDSQIFDFIKDSQNSSLFLICKFSVGFWNYMSSGNACVLVLGACLGSLLITLLIDLVCILILCCKNKIFKKS